ncbi:hypothetical protein CFR78_04960 [Komagataeibacter rhaeticus]|nr:hypothetical protein GLUCORHAEAF1_04220 [Komagataeibacter rhaeticus AF1]PYD54307.1 hypothetical protein CFR78_04960 [Komagataeibacter rhaeticus]
MAIWIYLVLINTTSFVFFIENTKIYASIYCSMIYLLFEEIFIYARHNIIPLRQTLCDIKQS